MAEKNESSVLFSLQELMNLEEERINEEESAKAARDRAERERAEAEARAKRDAEERALRAEEDRRRAEELRRREEEARLEAIKHAELAKAQHEAEHKSRMEALTAQQAHEQRIAALQSDEHKKKLKVGIGVAAGVLVVALVGGGLAFKSASEKAEKEKAALLAQAESLKAEADQNVKRLEEQLKTSSTMNEAQKAALEKQILEAKAKAAEAGEGVKKTGGGGGGYRPAKPAGGSSKPKSNCAEGDPMCAD